MAYQTIPPSTAGANAWAVQQQNRMKAAAPLLTKFTYMKQGQNPLASNIAAVTGDASGVGGVLLFAGGTGRIFGVSIFQQCLTKSFGIAFRGALLGPTSGRVAQLGLSNVANSNVITVETAFAVDPTKYVLHIVGAGTTDVVSTLVADLGYHDFMITGDATTVTMWVDGINVASTSTLTNISDQPMFMYAFDTTAGDTLLLEALYGYISP